MAAMTAEQRARILEAFVSTADPYAHVEPPTNPEWSAFYYDGYITLAGLLHLATVIAAMRLDTPPQR